jgi:hypothetical protein
VREDPSHEPPTAAPGASVAAIAPIIRVPVFAVLALVGVLFDLVFGRATLLTLGDSIPQETRAFWLRTSTFGFNLATLAGALALFVMVSRIARRGDAVPIIGRLALAIFGGVFVATLALALTEEPSVLLQRQLMLGRAGGYMLMSLLAVVGLRARHRGMQLGLTMWAAMVFSSLVVLVMEIGQAPRLAAQVKVFNESLWLLIPVAFAPALGAFDARGRYRTLAFGLATMVTVLVWQWVLDEAFPPVFYGVFQLDALRGTTTLYAPILGVVVGVCLSAATGRDASQRMGGVALLLMVGAGHLPRSVGMMVVQALSLSLLVWFALGKRAFGHPVSGPTGDVPL